MVTGGRGDRPSTRFDFRCHRALCADCDKLQVKASPVRMTRASSSKVTAQTAVSAGLKPRFFISSMTCLAMLCNSPRICFPIFGSTLETGSSARMTSGP